MQTNENWLKSPSKNQMYLVLLVWVISVSLSILAITNLFTESLFQAKFFMLYSFIVGATSMAFMVVKNYLKTN